MCHVSASMIACFMAIPYLLFALYYFAFQLDLQLQGIGLAYSLYAFALLVEIQIVLFCFVPEVRDAYFLPTKEALQGWSEYLKLAIPVVICIFVLYIPYEICIVLAGRINENEQAATTIIVACLLFYAQISNGDRESAQAYIGNLIGANLPK